MHDPPPYRIPPTFGTVVSEFLVLAMVGVVIYGLLSFASTCIAAH